MNQTCVSISENSLHRKITLCVFSPISEKWKGIPGPAICLSPYLQFQTEFASWELGLVPARSLGLISICWVDNTGAAD